MVMESIYLNQPAGVDAIGRFVDRIALSSPASRAVRWRSLAVSAALNRLAPQTVLSVPAGTARDVARLASSMNVYSSILIRHLAWRNAECRERHSCVEPSKHCQTEHMTPSFLLA